MKTFFLCTILLCCLTLVSCQSASDTYTQHSPAQSPKTSETSPSSQPSASPSETPVEAPAESAKPSEKPAPVCQASVKRILPDGDVVLSCTYSKLVKKKIRPLDIISLQSDAVSLQIPVCYKPSDVNLRCPFLRVDSDSEQVSLSMNIGRFAKLYDVSRNTTFTLQRLQKNGYAREYQAHQHAVTDSRNDYKTDTAFANFREIHTTGIAPKTLYRGGNPLEYIKSPNRPRYSARLIQKYRIGSALNLANTRQEIKNFFQTTTSPYYKKLWEQGNIFTGHVTTDLYSDEFMDGVIPALRFMLHAPKPYYIHCNMGKDRTGFLCAILEALMGASYDEIVEEYMISFENLLGVKKTSEDWEILADGNIRAILNDTFVSPHVDRQNLSEAAAGYLKEHGMDDDEIEKLKQILS